MLDLISLHDTPDTEDRFEAYLKNVCETFGFDDAAYAGINPVNGTMHAIVTYSDEWQEYYQKHNLHAIDPTLAAAMKSIAPVDWHRLRQEPNFNKVFDPARSFGIGDMGITIPIRGPYGELGMLSVSHNCSLSEWNKLRDLTITDLQQAAAHSHDNVMYCEPLSKSLHHPQLSTRELEVLQWLAIGKSQQDVADILNISARTVEVHTRSSREKLTALTTPQAIGRAIGMKLIFAG